MDSPPAIIRLFWKAASGFGMFHFLGRMLLGQRLAAVAFLTVKAAFRYRLVVVLASLLMLTVVGLPVVIKDDGTARGLTQILLTYTLGIIATLLGFATLWLSCGTLARDIEECQIQMVAVKPIARWQIWLGKWIGIMLVNVLLLTLSGGAVYFLIQWRAGKLKPEQQIVLRNEVLVGRGAAREKQADLAPQVDKILADRLKDPKIAEMDRDFVRKEITEMVKASEQVVAPQFRRRWIIDLSSTLGSYRDRPLFLRVKFHAAKPTQREAFAANWFIGPPETPKVRRYSFELAADSHNEFPIDSSLVDEQGKLTVEFWNFNDMALLFPLEDGLEVLYHECGFGMNYVRGLMIVLLWIGLLAALGLAAASFLTFPVAAFFSLSMLIVGLSGGTLSKVVEDRTVMPVNHETGRAAKNYADLVLVPAFTVLLKAVNLVEGFSPIDSLSSGRSISWRQIGLAAGQIGFLFSGAFAVFGMTLFSRRELATAQANQ